MKPKTAAQKVSNVLWNRFIIKYKLHRKPMSEIIKELKEIKPELTKLYRIAMKEYPDGRLGEETYGYESDELIIDNLIYLSDRWNSAHRLKWILDLIELK